MRWGRSDGKESATCRKWCRDWSSVEVVATWMAGCVVVGGSVYGLASGVWGVGARGGPWICGWENVVAAEMCGRGRGVVAWVRDVGFGFARGDAEGGYGSDGREVRVECGS